MHIVAVETCFNMPLLAMDIHLCTTLWLQNFGLSSAVTQYKIKMAKPLLKVPLGSSGFQHYTEESFEW
jgi:hypothetical protein